MSARRLLAVYDLAVQPDTVDQLCLFQAAVQVLVAYFQLDKVDVCFLLNCEAPLARLPQKEMAMERALHLLPCVQFLPGLGSVFIREESGQLQSLLAGQNYAEIWPPPALGRICASPRWSCWGPILRLPAQFPALSPARSCWAGAAIFTLCKFYRRLP
jgi:hypothetical protein